MRWSFRPHPRAAALVLVLALTLTGCGDDAAGKPSESRTASNGDVLNDADVEFANQMIPHHAQAIEMVVLAQGRPLDPAVRELADAVRDAQVPEVQTMVGWLTEWGEEIPETSLDHANSGHGPDETEHPGDTVDLPGMMSADAMQELAGASDGDFQDLWLEMMIEHHRGAVELAQRQQELGAFRPAVRLADRIAAAQETEIATMEGLLG